MKALGGRVYGTEIYKITFLMNEIAFVIWNNQI